MERSENGVRLLTKHGYRLRGLRGLRGLRPEFGAPLLPSMDMWVFYVDAVGFIRGILFHLRVWC